MRRRYRHLSSHLLEPICKKVKEPSLKANQIPKSIDWLNRMDGALHWRIMTPSFGSPYGPPLSERVMAELSVDKSALLAYFEMKCLVDGYEVLHVKNLRAPSISTDHPCLTGISRDWLFRFLEQTGVDKKVDEEVTRIQQELNDLLDAKEKAAEEQLIKKGKKVPEKKGIRKPKAGGGIQRIVRRG